VGLEAKESKMADTSQNAPESSKQAEERWLDIREVRLVSDLRIMHSKVDELYHVVMNLKQHHDQAAIHRYADAPILAENIRKVERIYLWFVALKEELGDESQHA
jgi:hypothetical protein